MEALDSTGRTQSQDDASQTNAVKETQQLTRGLSEDELKKEAAQRGYHRNEKFRDHFEKIATVFLYLIAVVFFAVGFAWFYHLLTPEEWHFIGAGQVAKLQNIVTGGLLTGLAAGHVKKRLG